MVYNNNNSQNGMSKAAYTASGEPKLPTVIANIMTSFADTIIFCG